MGLQARMSESTLETYEYFLFMQKTAVQQIVSLFPAQKESDIEIVWAQGASWLHCFRSGEVGFWDQTAVQVPLKQTYQAVSRQRHSSFPLEPPK